MKVLDNHQNNVTAKFEQLYDRYSPKIFGFIRQYSASKEEAEEYLINVFCNVHKEINNLEVNDERSIQRIVLLTCKTIFKSQQSNANRLEVAHE